MIHLNSIELVNFKGITRLTCDFHEVTVLAGLNNSGKTTILQAVYLLVASLPRIAVHPHIDHPQRQGRVIAWTLLFRRWGFETPHGFHQCSHRTLKERSPDGSQTLFRLSWAWCEAQARNSCLRFQSSNRRMQIATFASFFEKLRTLQPPF